MAAAIEWVLEAQDRKIQVIQSVNESKRFTDQVTRRVSFEVAHLLNLSLLPTDLVSVEAVIDR